MTFAERLATLSLALGVAAVLLLFAPWLEAPFLVPKLAALHAAGALGFVALALAKASGGAPRWDGRAGRASVLVGGTTLAAWGAAALRPEGAPYGGAAVARWAALFGIACGTTVIAGRAEARALVLQALTATLGVVAAIGLLQHAGFAPGGIPVISTPGSTFGNRNLAAEVVAVGLPMVASFVAFEAPADKSRSSRVALALGAVGLLCTYLAVTRARAAWAGGATGLATMLVLARPRWPGRVWASAAAVLFCAVVASAIPGRFDPRDAGDAKRYAGVVHVLEQGLDTRTTAVRTRLGLWRRTIAMVRDHPLAGVGPGNWPVVFPRYAEPGAAEDGVLAATLAPRQAHQDLLERAAETGIAGALALAALFVAAGLAARDLARSKSAAPSTDAARARASGAGGAGVALAVVSLAGFPLEMPGTLLLAGIALGFVAAAPAAKARASAADPGGGARAAWGACAMAGLLLFGLACVRAERSVRASAWARRAEDALHRDHGPTGAAEALGALRFAQQAEPDDYRTRLRIAQMLLRQKRADESAAAARDAVALEPAAPNGWAALAAAELEGGDVHAALEDSGKALALLHEFPFALQIHAAAAERAGQRLVADADRAHLRALASGPEEDETAREARALSDNPRPVPGNQP